MRRPIVIAVVAVAIAACAGVLGLRRERSRTFPHRAHVVKGVSCVQCHPGITEAGDGRTAPPARRRHLHHRRLSRAAARSAAVRRVPPRSDGAGRRRRGARSPQVLPRQPSGGGGRQLRALPRRGRGQRWPAAPGDGGVLELPRHDRAREVRDCAACHVDLVEEGVAPTSHLVHDDDFATRHGPAAAAAADLCSSCHREPFCASCHGVTAPTIAARLRPSDPMSTSVHRPGFINRHGEDARVAPSACTSCHQPDRCLDCHQDRGVASTGASPHPPGVGRPRPGRQ
jgi:hypothetical protein